MCKDGFPVVAEITSCHSYIKEINHARTRSQYFNENVYCKNCLRVFSFCYCDESRANIPYVSNFERNCMLQIARCQLALTLTIPLF